MRSVDIASLPLARLEFLYSSTVGLRPLVLDESLAVCSPRRQSSGS